MILQTLSISVLKPGIGAFWNSEGRLKRPIVGKAP
jgi:hypothetical protein